MASVLSTTHGSITETKVRKRPTLEEALEKHGIKSIAKTRAAKAKVKAEKSPTAARKKNPYSPVTQPKEHAAWRVKNAGA